MNSNSPEFIWEAIGQADEIAHTYLGAAMRFRASGQEYDYPALIEGSRAGVDRPSRDAPDVLVIHAGKGR
jgi:hypothetical protein